MSNQIDQSFSIRRQLRAGDIPDGWNDGFLDNAYEGNSTTAFDVLEKPPFLNFEECARKRRQERIPVIGCWRSARNPVNRKEEYRQEIQELVRQEVQVKLERKMA